MLELLILITNSNNDKRIKIIRDKYNVPFSLTSISKGTASSSILEYFGLEEIRKYTYFSLINANLKKDIMNDINQRLKLSTPGNGICFTIPISSTTKYINEKLITNKEVNMEKDKNSNNYELIVTIVTEGYSEKVMNSAKKAGAGGGTLIKGRSLATPNKKRQFLGFSIEPEKDVILIVAKKEKKKDIMETITQDAGLKTKGGGIIFSLPITSAIGLIEEK